MNTEKAPLYWIKREKGRLDEIIKTLEEKGGTNDTFRFINTDTDDVAIYFIGAKNSIACCNGDSYLHDFIRWHGTELYLPEKKKVLTWDDCEKDIGWQICSEGVIHSWKNKDSKKLFATEQQAKSAQAAAMIAQIREQGCKAYGKIVPKGNPACIITMPNKYTVRLSEESLYLGGLLRFGTEKQASLFIDNNREIVEQYLNTF